MDVREGHDQRKPDHDQPGHLIGMEGRVKTRVDSTTISGKVLIASTEWSARSNGLEIPPGKKVKVVDSQGVHIVVEEVK
jgi:inner membrane protein